jgi:hypothetical protein
VGQHKGGGRGVDGGVFSVRWFCCSIPLFFCCVFALFPVGFIFLCSFVSARIEPASNHPVRTRQVPFWLNLRFMPHPAHFFFSFNLFYSYRRPRFIKSASMASTRVPFWLHCMSPLYSRPNLALALPSALVYSPLRLFINPTHLQHY